MKTFLEFVSALVCRRGFRRVDLCGFFAMRDKGGGGTNEPWGRGVESSFFVYFLRVLSFNAPPLGHDFFPDSELHTLLFSLVLFRVCFRYFFSTSISFSVSRFRSRSWSHSDFHSHSHSHSHFRNRFEFRFRFRVFF